MTTFVKVINDTNVTPYQQDNGGEFWIPLGGGGGAGTVTSVSVVTANGVSGSVANPTSTPAITLTLGAITPSSVQISGLTASLITATDASKNLVSLATATYPSLTELSYVKGLSSAVQTQMDTKFPYGGGTFTGAVEATDHGTASTDQVINVCYGTSATPPTASGTTEGTLYIQYTA